MAMISVHTEFAKKEFLAEGRKIKPVKNRQLEDAFWMDGCLVIVQLDPSHFPAEISPIQRDLIQAERRRDGVPKSVLAVWISSNEDGLAFVKTKNFPGF